MKKYYIWGMSLVAALLMFTASCTESNYLDINDNPNYPAKASCKNLLPSAQASLATMSGYQGLLTGDFWQQYVTQGNSTNQYNTLATYTVTNGSGVPPCTVFWQYSYANALEDLRLALIDAEETETWNYWLVAKVLSAYHFLLLTDSYGDIPFTQALNEEYKTPEFEDSKTVVYPGILAMLDEAIAKKSDALASEKQSAMGVNDFFFGGDIDSWVKFAKSLKLKMYLKDYAANSDKIKALLNEGDLLKEDCAWTAWENSTDKSHPLYEMNIRQLNTTENIRACHTFLEFLKANNDPRVIYLYNPISASGYTVNDSPSVLFANMQTAYEGLPFGDKSDVNTTDLPISKSSRMRQAYDDPLYLMNKSEALLMIAEAYARANDNVKAKEYYDDAVIAGFERWNLDELVDVDSYVNGAYAFDASNALKSIGMQYWVTYAGANAYDGWMTRNRLGYPEIIPNVSVRKSYLYGENDLDDGYVLGCLVDPNGSALQPGQNPKRLMYPTNTTQYNSAAEEYVQKNGNDLTKKLWWQK